MPPFLWGVIVLSVILGLMVAVFIGFAIRRWLAAQREEQKQRERVLTLTNLERASELIEKIYTVRAVQRELKSAFARSELDGGARAAVKHELYIEAQAELDRLHDALMILI